MLYLQREKREAADRNTANIATNRLPLITFYYYYYYYYYYFCRGALWQYRQRAALAFLVAIRSLPLMTLSTHPNVALLLDNFDFVAGS